MSNNTEKKCGGDCWECPHQADMSAKMHCAAINAFGNTIKIQKKIKAMEAKMEVLTEQMAAVYNAVSPHVEAIGDPDLVAFCTMVENKMAADAEAEAVTEAMAEGVVGEEAVVTENITEES